MRRGQVPIKCPENGAIVRFYLTNQWHYGKIVSVGWKWITIQYKKHGKWKYTRILKQNANTDLAEI